MGIKKESKKARMEQISAMETIWELMRYMGSLNGNMIVSGARQGDRMEEVAAIQFITSLQRQN